MTLVALLFSGVLEDAQKVWYYHIKDLKVHKSYLKCVAARDLLFIRGFIFPNANVDEVCLFLLLVLYIWGIL